MISRLLLVLDDTGLLERLRTFLSRGDVIVESASGAEDLPARIARQMADLVLISRTFLPRSPFDTVRLLCALPDAPSIIILQPKADAEEEAGLLATGCDAVVLQELPVESIMGVVDTVLEKCCERRKGRLRDRPSFATPRLSDFVSASRPMRTFLHVVARVVASDVSLLLLGETGVGKERLARAIHAEGPRSQGPFVAVNCGALPESLLESELFGHAEGAFTGATRARRGWFELAHGGTIFLDEIGEMPLHLQVKLLRVLQEHEIQRVGSEKAITADVRVMAATNRDLEAEVEAGRFRRDLYYRLSVVTLTIPPLRERREDIPELVESYLTYLRARVGRPVTGIAADALEALTRYSWPGNVRELINVIERAMLLCEDEEVSLNDLPSPIRSTVMPIETDLLAQASMPSPDDVPHAWLERPLAEVREDLLRKFEHVYLVGLLRETGGRINETARRAGIRPRSLYDKMKHHGLRKEDFRRPLTR